MFRTHQNISIHSTYPLYDIFTFNFLKPFCKKEKLYPEQVRYGGTKTNPKFRVFIDQMEFSDLSYLKELEILMHFKKSLPF